jgi:aryl-alcohol dehydrogenase-like predicted oxidoreductase
VKRIEGRATAEGTTRYRERLAGSIAAGHFRELGGPGGPWLSSIGLGTGPGAADSVTDQQYGLAVARALELGLNVFDTGVTYRHQRSERALGQALTVAIDAGQVRRDEVVVATKGGYVPFEGSPPPDPRALIEALYVRTGVFRWEEVVGSHHHCLAPRFLADQVERSRRNLGLDTLDIYYLHNPEIQLSEVSREEFRRRLRAAFEALEAACAAGQLGVYGAATRGGYLRPPEAIDYLAVAEFMEVARDVGGADHHFRALELPYSLGMPEAFLRANQAMDGVWLPVLEVARRSGLYVMASGSLLGGRLAGLLAPSVGDRLPGFETNAQRALQFVRSTPGVGTALVGMRDVAHVEENSRVAGRAPAAAEAVRAIFQPTA